MKKRVWGIFALFLVLLLAAGTALAADTFKFEDKSITLFEGERSDTGLIRDGACAEDGEITYTSAKSGVAAVEQDGTITAVKKGSTTITAKLTVGKKTWKASMTVNVLRAVTDVTLNTTKLSVYQYDDPILAGLVDQPDPELAGDEIPEEMTWPVILLAAGKSATLSTTCTPSDASNKKIEYASSDEGVLKISGGSMKAIQGGESILTITSVQNPEISETFRVIVTEPVKKVTVTGESKTVFAGETIQLEAACEPDTATFKSVTWSSRAPKIATVSEDGTVTGVAKGSTTITATAADGSGKSGAFSVTVQQKPTGLVFKETSLNLVAGRSGQVHATVQPASANDKTLIWSTSDPSVATVNNQGKVTAVGRGECTISAVCSANDDVYASVPVSVVQRVTAITFANNNVSTIVRNYVQLDWTVLPADATDPSVTFSSSNTKVAVVDQYGLVTGVSRGTARIYAKAKDGSGVQGQATVQVIQPVEGVSIQYPLYHVQIGEYMNIKALIQPSNANNIAVDWTSDDTSVVTVQGRGKNVGTMQGLRQGAATVTGTTQDGGFSASATVRVDDYNRAVVVDYVYLENGQIRIALRNRGSFSVQKVYFTAECYGMDPDTGADLPLVCNVDGVSTSFSGVYEETLHPEETTNYYDFYYKDYVQPYQPITCVRVIVTGWQDAENYTRTIPEDQRPDYTYRGYSDPGTYYTMTPPAVVTPVPADGDDDGSVG